MTTQEAKIKSNIPRKTHDQTTTELYFPNLRSTYHAIFSGNAEICNSHIPNSGLSLIKLTQQYREALDAAKSTVDLPIKVEFTAQGVDFGVVIKKQDEAGNPITEMMVYSATKWTSDQQTLTMVAKLCDKVNLDCVRLIPNLASDFQNFKNIYQIDTNPMFDFMAFTYALYDRLKLADSIAKCYVQVLMGRRKTTYLALVQAVKYKTVLPSSVTDWFNNDIVKEKTYTMKGDEGKETKTTNVWSLLLIDYAGKAFNHQLKLQVGPKNVNFEGSTNIIIDTDATVCPN